MKYNTIKFNDIANGPGIAVSVYLQGCPHKCPNCFNPETWDFNGGQEFTQATMDSIIQGLTANNTKRHLSLLGGEPLCPENSSLTLYIVETVKERLPDTKVYIWTGYLYEQLLQSKDVNISKIFNLADILIDGPYIEAERDITLLMRGSRNQRIINLKQKE